MNLIWTSTFKWTNRKKKKKLANPTHLPLINPICHFMAHTQTAIGRCQDNLEFPSTRAWARTNFIQRINEQSTPLPTDKT